MPASFRQGSRPCSPMRVRVSSHRGKVTEPGFMQHMSAHDVPNPASGRSRRPCHRSDALRQSRPRKSRRRSPSTTSVVPHILRDMSSHRIQVALPASVGRLPCRMVFEACRESDVSMPVAHGDLGRVPLAWLDAELARLMAASVRFGATPSANSASARRAGQRSAPDFFQAPAQHFSQGVFQALVAGARNRR